MPPIDPDSPRTLNYTSPGQIRRAKNGFPWGLASLTCGFAAVVGIPSLEGTRSVPGIAMDQMAVVGMATALIAISCGLAAARKRRQTGCGIAGCALGVLALVIIPKVAHL